MRRLATCGAIIVVVLCGVACNDSSPSASARISKNWIVSMSASGGGDLLEKNLEVRIEGVEFGEDAPDGTVVTITTSGGIFANGQATATKSTVDAEVAFVVTFPSEGTYQLHVESDLTEADMTIVIRS